jgi:hypothetical protein
MKAITEMRTDLLRHQRDFYANVDETLADFPTEAYVVGMGEKRTRAQAMAQLLDQHSVEMYELDRQVEADGQTFAPGEAYVVPLDQPQGRFVKAVMERTSTYPDSIFYDVSTWTLPLAFGVDYAALESASGLQGERMTSVAYDGGGVTGGRSEYAYVFDWGRYFAPRALYRLQKNGIRPRLMDEPFAAPVGGQARSFERGAIVVPLQQRDVPRDTVHAVVERVAEFDHIQVYATDTGLSPQGPDLGSRGAEVLQPPKVALLTGTGSASSYGTSAYNAGEVWHLMTERMGVPISLVDVGAVENADMSRYNTLVLAGGNYGALPAEKVKEWVRDGGRLIALEDAVEWPIEQEMVSMEERSVDYDSLLQGTDYADLPNAYGAQQVGGSIFQINLDTTHPLAYGYDESVPVFHSGNTFYAPSTSPGTNVATYDEENPRLSGYISDDVLELVRGSASIEGHNYGGGNIILMMDNPNFRAFWYGTNGLFLNAVFFGDTF